MTHRAARARSTDRSVSEAPRGRDLLRVQEARVNTRRPFAFMAPENRELAPLPFTKDDGGREAAGFRGSAGDCVARSIAIATRRPYAEVYDALADGTGRQRASPGRDRRPRSAANGIDTKRAWFRDYMTSLGFSWEPTMQIGSGCLVHLAIGEVPNRGRLVVCVSRHYTAVVDGVIFDTSNPSRDGTRCVYGI